MNKPKTVLALAVTTILASACSSTPETVVELEEARSTVVNLRQNPDVDQYARSELERAESALNRAEQAYADGDELTTIVHEAYMAQGYADIASAKAEELAARETIEDAELQRTRVLEQKHERDAQLARQQAEAARMDATMAGARADQLQAELADLQAKETDRGLVLTLGDVLFDTGEATLKPGATKTITRLADFLAKHEDRRLLIEGHTDSRGSDAFNQQLSQKRADAVRAALMSNGVAAERLRATGLGEEYPVATNETAAGRQENRRVDIVVSRDSEEFPETLRDPSALRN